MNEQVIKPQDKTDIAWSTVRYRKYSQSRSDITLGFASCDITSLVRIFCDISLWSMGYLLNIQPLLLNLLVLNTVCARYKDRRYAICTMNKEEKLVALEQASTPKHTTGYDVNEFSLLLNFGQYLGRFDPPDLFAGIS